MAYVTFQFRRDTAANWTAANPTLSAGEMGFETDTFVIKIGDGLTAWNTLGAISYTAAEVDAALAAITLDSLSDVTLTTPATDAVLQYNGSGWVDALLSSLYNGTTKVLEAGASEVVITDRQLTVDRNNAAYGSIYLLGTSGGSVDLWTIGVPDVWLGGIWADATTLSVYSALSPLELITEQDDKISLQHAGVEVMHTDSSGILVDGRRLNIKPAAGNPGSPANGDVWYNSTTGKFMAQQAAASYELVERVIDIGLFIQDAPSATELVCRWVATRAFSIPSGATLSRATAATASTGSVDFDLLKNGVSFGTLNFNASATGTFTVASPVSFAAGDVLTITAPVSPDGTLANISISLAGSRL